MKKVDIFLPPGVQQNLFARLRTNAIPRQATPALAAKINALWMARNNAPEQDLAAIDARMEELVIARVLADNGRKTRVIFENHNLHGIGDKRCKVFVLPGRSSSRNQYDYWALVTDVPCPACGSGTILWHEAGYVPGYRICDKCKRTFLARGDMRHPKLILDTK